MNDQWEEGGGKTLCNGITTAYHNLVHICPPSPPQNLWEAVSGGGGSSLCPQCSGGHGVSAGEAPPLTANYEFLSWHSGAQCGSAFESIQDLQKKKKNSSIQILPLDALIP